MMSTRCPAPLSRSANQRPIFPYPPMIAMWWAFEAVLGMAAWSSTDSCMSVRETLSA